jgi:site-specific DNA-methyltransferase (adenine-specific)
MRESKLELHNVDCLPFMRKCADKQFDWAIVDPPYGNNDAIGLKDNASGKKQATKRTNYKMFDNVTPTDEYFSELKRISKNQIVWGANFFGLTGGYLCWNKNGTAFGQAELAYVSSINSVKVYEYTWNGMLQGNMKDKEIRIHPTQKPVQLYKYLLTEFVKEGETILDTHLGSGSIALACWDMKFNLVALEIDEHFFLKANKRLEAHKKQLTLF